MPILFIAIFFIAYWLLSRRSNPAQPHYIQPQYKCRWCRFKSAHYTEFCPKCKRDLQGFTLIEKTLNEVRNEQRNQREDINGIYQRLGIVDKLVELAKKKR